MHPGTRPEIHAETRRAADGTRAVIRSRLTRGRAALWEAFDAFAPGDRRRQILGGFSPVVWHVGHIVFTEFLWLLAECRGDSGPDDAARRLYAADGLPKSLRHAVPDDRALRAFGDDIRDRTLAYLDDTTLDRTERYWHFVAQHEAQHLETIAILLHALDHPAPTRVEAESDQPEAFDAVAVPGGSALLGDGAPDALDNEGPAHRVSVAPFALQRRPVTEGAFARFVAAKAYTRPEYWSEAGWAWRERHGVTGPRYGSGDASRPVMGVSAHEADAYAAWAGVRLPTETEWEYAARVDARDVWDQAGGNTDAPAGGRGAGPGRRFPWGDGEAGQARADLGRLRGGPGRAGARPRGRSALGLDDLAGGVWEWTRTIFAPYAGYRAFPYDGYSGAYFDGRHRVLKGGSWATREWALRSSFRNWYTPDTRDIFAGFRCALSAPPEAAPRTEPQTEQHSRAT